MSLLRGQRLLLRLKLALKQQLPMKSKMHLNVFDVLSLAGDGLIAAALGVFLSPIASAIYAACRFYDLSQDSA